MQLIQFGLESAQSTGGQLWRHIKGKKKLTDLLLTHLRIQLANKISEH